jgi:hypothetical protein
MSAVESKSIPKGPITFRVRGTRAQGGVVVGLILGGAVAVVGQLQAQEAGIACAAGMVLGFIGGKLRRSDHCSDPACGATIGDPQARRCPKCDRPIAGTVDQASDRLAAEERVRKRQHSGSDRKA